MLIFGIKNLKREYIRLRNENQILKIEAETERIYKEYWKDKKKKIEKDIDSRNKLIEKLNEYTGVTKLEIAANTEVKFQFDKPRIFLIIE